MLETVTYLALATLSFVSLAIIVGTIGAVVVYVMKRVIGLVRRR